MDILKHWGDITDFFSRRTRYGASEVVSKFLYLLCSLILGWGLIIPVLKIIPRKKNRIVFIGRDDGVFIDNTKYFFHYLNSVKESENLEVFYLTENRDCHKELNSNDYHSVFYPSFSALFIMITSGILVVDHDVWVFRFKFFFLYSAFKVQLFHGVGLKYLGLQKIKKEMKTEIARSLQVGMYRIIGMIPYYDVIISTSEFYSNNVFSKAFRAGKVVETGYPRNDIFFAEDSEDIRSYWINADGDTYRRVINLRQEGYKIIFYMPTFRDSGGDPMSDRALDMKGLNEFSQKNRFIFIFKFHPDPYFTYEKIEFSNIIWYDNANDVYPAIPLGDLLITDYSSIYMDFLLLDRPVIFFPYDYEKYIRSDRGIQFDYEWITPGRKCRTPKELQDEITKILVQGLDDHREKRKEILDIAFKYKDGNSSERLWTFIKNETVNL
jgi:CDP-glycerol glycerophosphotransferase